MKRSFSLSVIILLLVCAALPSTVSADSSHARIVRLSYVQGDVRFVRQFHEDSLADPNAMWEGAQLNLPIREGNALSTGNGRAEVEFENGAMAFLGPNTAIEFYDLSLHDGSRITRIILRQGSVSLSAHSVNGDYFSVTGGDFSVEVTQRATFRLENFDDGSTVSVQNGHVTVLQNDKSTPLEKGQSLTVNAQDPGNPLVAKASPNDDFDRWVAGRIQNEQAAANQLQSGATYGNYVSGYSDLFTYGSWMSVNGFNCWRPFGVGLGWSPFDYGNWYMDASIGWSFIGSAPWGWLPYHYGGWYFAPGYGWVWNPGGLFSGRPTPYRPVTAVFVHTGDVLGVVPMHPSDKPGKTPLNLNQAVYRIQDGKVGRPVMIVDGDRWSVLKNSRDAGLAARIPAATSPLRVNRTITSNVMPGHEATFVRGSSIVYDASQHRFVNPTQGRVGTVTSSLASNEIRTSGKDAPTFTRTSVATVGNASASHAPNIPSAPRASSPPPRPSITPAPPHTSGGGSSGGSRWGGGGGSSSSTGSSRPSGSGGGGSSSPSAGSSHPSSSGSSGRPH